MFTRVISGPNARSTWRPVCCARSWFFEGNATVTLPREDGLAGVEGLTAVVHQANAGQDTERELAYPALEDIAGMASDLGLGRVRMLAWRDIEDPEAGGSELHAHRIASLWAKHGIDVELRTSQVGPRPTSTARDGYRVVRRGGRYSVFPRSAMSTLLGGDGRPDALVEIWNGMPFLSPVWSRCPRVVFLHHVHAEMWRMVLPRALAAAGETFECRVAPLLYRRSRIVTLSRSSRAEIAALLGIPFSQITVVPPGVEEGFSPGVERTAHPSVLAVGRLVPVKRFDMLLEAVMPLRERYPELTLTIIGEGYERPSLEALIHSRGAGDWVSLPGRLGDEALRAAYRRSWVLASASLREGWGMTITEAGACGTPAVVTDIAGHRDAVLSGHTGFLVRSPAELTGALDMLIADPALRSRLGAAALAHANCFTWEAAAAGTLSALVGVARARRARGYR